MVKAKASETNSKKRPKGASRNPGKGEGYHWQEWLQRSIKYWVMFGAVGGVFAIVILMNPKDRIEDFTHTPIREVLIEGKFHFFNKEDAHTIIKEYVNDSFLDLDIQKLKDKLEVNPWVDSVNITREWPDKLIVKISEQKAIARWGKEKFLNMRGDIITVTNTKKMDELPFLNGNDNYAKEVMKQYLRMGKLLQQNDLKLMSVELDETLAWSLTVDQEIKIKLGRERIWEKLQQLMVAKEKTLQDQFYLVEQIDMRYPSGFAVAWKKSQEQFLAKGA